MTFETPEAPDGLVGRPPAIGLPLEIGPDIDRSEAASWSNFKRFWSVIRLQRSKLLVIIVGTVVLAVARLGNLLLIRTLFDQGIGHRDLRRLWFCGLGMMLIPLVTALIERWQTITSVKMGHEIVHTLKHRLYVHLQKMPIGFFSQINSGEIQALFSQDIGALQSLVRTTAPMFVISSVTLVSSAAALLYLAPILSLITLAVAPLIIISSYRRGSFRRIMNAERQRVGIHLSSIIHQTLSASGVMLIKNTGRQEYVCEQVRKLNVRLMALDMQQALYLKGGLMMFSRIVTAILPAIIYIVAGWQIINHRQLFGVNITAGTLVAFISLQARFLSPMRQLALMQTNLTTSLVHLERVLNHLELPLPIEEPQDPVRLEREEMRGEVHFRDVSFSYPVLRPERATISSAAEFCLTGLSFNINPGEKVALVGASGAGKTTVSYLLSRLYDVAGGAVLIDGHDVRSLSFATLSGLISVVTQESFLFHDTVRNNLLFARLDATESQIVNACKAAAIHERILKLPHSYDTMVGERGARFSGGEKQRLSIARAILKDSPILILDEATSSLDSCSEDIVQAALNRLTVGRSTLIIAHRLSTVVIADRIVVFDAGKMVDQGSHLELLRRCTVYRTLYANQFGVGKKTEESDRVPVSC